MDSCHSAIPLGCKRKLWELTIFKRMYTQDDKTPQCSSEHSLLGRFGFAASDDRVRKISCSIQTPSISNLKMLGLPKEILGCLLHETSYIYILTEGINIHRLRKLRPSANFIVGKFPCGGPTRSTRPLHPQQYVCYCS